MIATSEKDNKLHSKLVNKMRMYTLNEQFCFVGKTVKVVVCWKRILSSQVNVRTSKLTVVLDYYEAIETYSRIGLIQSYGNLQTY
jgi:hypothetical protein